MKLNRWLVFLFSFFIFLQVSKATITITSVSGASYVESEANGSFTIYGGVAGSCASTDGVSTCNSCTGTSASVIPAVPCNQKSVYPSLQIVVSFKSTVALANYKTQIAIENAAGLDVNLPLVFKTAAANEVQTLTLTWLNLCNNDAGLTNCTPASAEAAFSNTNKKIKVLVDESNNGSFEEAEKVSFDAQFHFIDTSVSANVSQDFCTAPSSLSKGMCGYQLGVGDSKIYLQNLYGSSSSGGAPAKTISNAPDWFGVVLMAQDTSAVNNITIGTATNTKVLKYNSSYNLDENVIDGLTNYTNYCVLMGNINKAQNIFKFNNTGTLSAIASNVCASPSEVVGLLSDKSCFISTAAFGSDMADQVQILREFRNQFLLTNHWGKQFVKKYYELSPPIANLIKQSEPLKALVRMLLYPLIAVSWLFVYMGFGISVFILFPFCLIIFRLAKKSNRKMRVL